MLQKILEKANVHAEILTKSQAIKISRIWLNGFASMTKESTGKWRVGEHLWEAFACHIQPSIKNTKALTSYKEKQIEPFYIFDESGTHCYYCVSDEYPEFFNTGLDLYIMPISKAWTMVFCHDNVVYFSESDSISDDTTDDWELP
jgi:hypothetical protein